MKVRKKEKEVEANISVDALADPVYWLCSCYDLPALVAIHSQPKSEKKQRPLREQCRFTRLRSPGQKHWVCAQLGLI